MIFWARNMWISKAPIITEAKMKGSPLVGTELGPAGAVTCAHPRKIM